MAIEDALNQLENEANAQVAWALGDVLRLWAARDNWRNCLLLQHLETNAPSLTAWNELIRRTRLALANDTELQTKARILLSPPTIRFNDVMEDFIAEMMAAQYLRSLGHTEIHFLSDEDEIHTDLRSHCGEHTYVTEAKNLREPRALTKVAFSRWNHNLAESPDSYAFTANLVDIDDPLSDLTPEQEAAVNRLIDELPQWPRPSHRVRSLPGERRIIVAVGVGRPLIIAQGGGPFRLDGTDGLIAQGQRGLVLKLLDHTRKALGQLYADAVPHDFRRLLYARWKPPEQFVVTPEGVEEIRTNVRNGLSVFLGSSFPNLAVTIAHTSEDPDQTPLVDWP